MSALSLALAKTHLNITGSTHDTELQTVIDSAEAVIAKRCGPLESTATTARVAGGGMSLCLPVSPAVTLTSVTPVDDAALDVSDLHLDDASGTVTYDDGSGFPARYYTVVYNAGRSSVPADLLFAVKELVRHLWETQRGPSARPGSRVSDAAANTMLGAAYLLPFRVEQLIAPHVQGGFA